MQKGIKFAGWHNPKSHEGRHNAAIDGATCQRAANPTGRMERALAQMVVGLTDYCEAHADMYESGVLDDYFIGDHITGIAKGLRGLLNGETGRLDCGTLDALLLPLAEPDDPACQPNPYREAPEPLTRVEEAEEAAKRG